MLSKIDFLVLLLRIEKGEIIFDEDFDKII